MRIRGIDYMRSPDYTPVERVFSLLILLSRTEEGYTRGEIFEQIALYQADDERATARMFERDLAFLERMGFTVVRERRSREPAIYRVRNAERAFTKSIS